MKRFGSQLRWLQWFEQYGSSVLAKDAWLQECSQEAERELAPVQRGSRCIGWLQFKVTHTLEIYSVLQERHGSLESQSPHPRDKHVALGVPHSFFEKSLSVALAGLRLTLQTQTHRDLPAFAS